jgi:hypothetical protein
MNSSHYKVVRRGTTLGYALARDRDIWFTPASKTTKQLADEVHRGLLGECPLPKDTQLVAWQPEPAPSRAVTESYGW